MADDLVPLPAASPEAVQAHVADFEKWFVSRQQRHGLEGAPLSTMERVAIYAYIAWERAKHEGTVDADQD